MRLAIKTKQANSDFKTGLVLALLICGITIAGLFFNPASYNGMDGKRRFLPPGKGAVLGTDNFGRDVFSRIMAGAKFTIATAVITVSAAAAAGTALGMFSGFLGGIWDEIIMRLTDCLSSFPGILLALVTVSLMDNSPASLVTALFILFIPGFTRIMRSGMLQYKTKDFVSAARLAGVSNVRIIFVHIFPNLTPSLLQTSVLGLSNAILAESAMSYLGLGIQPPAPSWGRMLSESQNFLFNAPWCAAAPGIMIMLTVLSFHYLGEGLRGRD